MCSSVHSKGDGLPRVLHLFDSDTCQSLLEDLRTDRPRDLFVAVGGMRILPDGPRLLPARRRLLSGGDGGLARLLKHADAGGRIDCIHAWGMRSTAMLLRAPRERRQIASLDGFQADAPEAIPVATVLRTGRVESLIGSYRAQRAVLNVLGVVSRRSGQERVACPAINPERLSPRSHGLRDRWGAHEDSLVIGLIGSPVDDLNLLDQCGLPVRCRLLGHHVVMVVSSRGRKRGDLVRWMEKACPQVRLVFDDIVERACDVARSLDVAIAPAGVGTQTRICDVGPVMTMVAAGCPVVLGTDHPAGEYADREDLIRIGRSHDQHDSTRWLMARLKKGSGRCELKRAQDRYEGYRKAVMKLYPVTVQEATGSRIPTAAS